MPGRSALIVQLACLFALLTLVLTCGCATEKSPPGRALQILPAVLGDPKSDPLAIDPGWLPTLPPGAGGRAEDVVAFRLFDRYMYPGEPARGLLRINPHNLPWRQRVHFEVWDEPGLNLLWQDTATLQRDESYLVQVSPLAGPQFADQTLQVRVRANAFLVTERVYVLPWPTTASEAPARAPSQIEGEIPGAVFAMPLPAGPVGPGDQPASMVATPGEAIAAAAVLWPIQPIDSVSATLSFDHLPGGLARRLVATRVDVLADGKLSPLPPDGIRLRGGLSNIFVATIAVPADTPSGTVVARWTFRDVKGVELFSRPVSLTVVNIPLQPGPTIQARYLATLDMMLRQARAEGSSFRVRLLAERIERRIDEAANYYANLPPWPLAAACPEQRFPHKLRWLILRSIAQLSSAL